MKKIIVVAGVTASGKTKLGIELAKKYRGEIISADSVAVYKELNIGSAKPNQEEQNEVRHHLINQVSIEEGYNVAQFQKDARKAIDEITAKGKIPIVVGGTGLYINALINDYRFEEEEEHDDLDESTEILYQRLMEEKPELKEKVHPSNRKRIIRSLQRTVESNEGETPVYDACVLFLQGDRETLYNRINKRVEVMIENGLIEEVAKLIEKNPDALKLQAMQSIGYREFTGFFENEKTQDELISEIQRNTRRFAKRQMTWFRHKTKSHWIDIEHLDTVYDIIDSWINKK